MYNRAVEIIFEKIDSVYSEIEDELINYANKCQDKFEENFGWKGSCEEYVRILHFTKDIYIFRIEDISPYSSGEKKVNFNKLLDKIGHFYIAVKAYANRYFDDVYCAGIKEEFGFIYDVKNIIDKHLEKINPEILIFPTDSIENDERNKKFIDIYKLYEKLSENFILSNMEFKDDIRTVMGKVFKYIWKLNGDKNVDVIKLANKWNGYIQISYNKRFPKDNNLKVKKEIQSYFSEIEKIAL